MTRKESTRSLYERRLEYEGWMLEKGYSPEVSGFLASLLGKDTGTSIISEPETYAKYNRLLLFRAIFELGTLAGHPIQKMASDLESLRRINREH